MDGNCPFSKGRRPTAFEERLGIETSYKCDGVECELYNWGDNKCGLLMTAQAIQGIFAIMQQTSGFKKEWLTPAPAAAKVDAKPALTKQTEKAY